MPDCDDCGVHVSHRYYLVTSGESYRCPDCKPGYAFKPGTIGPLAGSYRSTPP